MPVEHMVWIKFKPDVSAQRIAEHLSNLQSLKGKVPGILALSLGENFTDRANGFTHGMIVTLSDKASLAAYGPHPEHQKVAGPLKQDADLMAMDYERA